MDDLPPEAALRLEKKLVRSIMESGEQAVLSREKGDMQSMMDHVHDIQGSAMLVKRSDIAGLTVRIEKLFFHGDSFDSVFQELVEIVQKMAT